MVRRSNKVERVGLLRKPQLNPDFVKQKVTRKIGEQEKGEGIERARHSGLSHIQKGDPI